MEARPLDRFGDDICHWCGRPAEADDPIEDHVVSPPVDGHRVEEGRFHRHCAAEAARGLVI